MSDTLDEIFNEGNRWKNKYRISWCHQCDTAIIACPECGNTSCNGGGCKQCHDDFEEFIHKVNHSVEKYLTDEEIDIYHKCLYLRQLIVSGLKRGEHVLDFKKLQEDGHLSKNQEEKFLK